MAVDGLEDDETDEESGSSVIDKNEREPIGDSMVEGPLLADDEEKACLRALRMWTEQNDRYRKGELEWEVLQRTREGETNVWVVSGKDQDMNRWTIWTPPGMRGKAPVPAINKADRLCGRVTSQLFSDPAVPEASPSGAEDEDRDAAEVESRILMDLDDESDLGDAQKNRRAFDLAHATGCGWVAYRISPTAGGLKPVEVEAGAGAQSVDDATVDPMTGAPWPELGQRYARADGMLTDDEPEAARKWHPGIVSEVLHPRHVRLWPTSALDIWGARRVIEAGYKPFAELEHLWPELSEVGDAEVLTKERPDQTERLLPKGWKKTKTPKDPADRLCFYLVVHGLPEVDYPEGLHFVMVGEKTMVRRGNWQAVINGQRTKMDLPYTQHIQFPGDPESPVYNGTMRALKGGNEARAMMVGAVTDIADRNANLKTFVPTTSTYQGKETMLGFLTHIPINPGGEPRREDPMPVPPEFVKLIEFWGNEMDDASSLQQAGQGLETADAASGRAKLAVLSQVHAGLSDIRQNAERAITRGWRVKSQLVRAYYETSRLVKWMGPDGSYKVERWQGSDLGSSRDIRIKPGSFSMLSPMQKAERALSLMQVPGLIDSPDSLRESVFGAVGAEVGWRENPHLMHVRRQIHEWEKGPDDGQAVPVPQAPPMAPDPYTGQMVPMGPPPPPGPDARAMAIFAPLPCDTQNDIAALRVRELGRAMASSTYAGMDPVWRGALDAAYEAMKLALQPPPVMAPGGPPGGAPAPQPQDPPAPPGQAGQPGPTAMLSPDEVAMAGGGAHA